ncbi:MAG: protease, partial [Candidatus Acidiferrales bacterium]
FSDESGEYALHLRDQNGLGEVRKINLGNPPSFFYSPHWSPDSKKIAYTDKRLNLWYVDLDKGTPVKIDTDTYDDPQRGLNPSWSPDSRWIAYTRELQNHLRAVFVYSLENSQSTQITDGMSDAEFAVFDKNGKYLYFTASTDIGPTTGWLDMSGDGLQVTRHLYLAVLGKDVPSPLAPESDEEKVAADRKDAPNDQSSAAKKDGDSDADKDQAKDKDQDKDQKKDKEKPPPQVAIDFKNIDQRIIAVPVPAKNYAGLFQGKENHVLLLENLPDSGEPGPPMLSLSLYDLSKRKETPLIGGIQSVDVSFNGEKYLYQQGDDWFIASTAEPAKPGEGKLKLEDMEVQVDPRAEWLQMYREIWRIERDFFYDPHYHGVHLA